MGDESGKFYSTGRERLKLWASQIGWLHSVPQRARKDDKRNRFEQYGEGHPYTCTPEIRGLEYLASAVQELGLVGQGGMSISPTSWQEIESYIRLTGSWLSSWDAQMLMEMSRAYVNWRNKGSEQGDIADDVPYIERNEETLAAMQAHLIDSRDRSAELTAQATK